MKKMIFFILCIFGLGAFFIHLYYTPRKKAVQYSIAFCTPTTHPALEEIERGFKEGLEQKCLGKEFTCTIFNANGNKSLLRAQAEEVVTGHYDLICTLGANFSQSVAELLHKKKIQTPQVFTAVDDPVFAQSLADTNPHSTGSYVQFDYPQQIDLLLRVKPDMRTLLLVYDPLQGVGLEADKQIVERYARSKGIAVKVVEVYQSNEIQQKVAALIPSVDVVLVFVDNTVVAGIDTLINLCNRSGVTLYASDLNSGKKGAALSYGITEYESGAVAANTACAILVGGKTIDQLPIRAITNRSFVLNYAVAQKQKVDTALYESIVKGVQQ